MEFTKEQIKAWKDTYGDVFQYTSKDGKTCILRSPTLAIIDACKAQSNGSSIKFDEALRKNCTLAGDPEFENSDKHKMGLYDWISTIIVIEHGKLVKL